MGKFRTWGIKTLLLLTFYSPRLRMTTPVTAEVTGIEGRERGGQGLDPPQTRQGHLECGGQPSDPPQTRS